MLHSVLLSVLSSQATAQEPVAPAPATAQATPLSLPYTYITLGYEQISVDGWDDDPNGPYISGSYGFDPNWFGFAGYSMKSGNVVGVDIDQDVFSLGAGYHTSVAPNTDVVIDAAFLRAELSSDALGASETLDGAALEVGIRSMVGERFELFGGIAFVDYEELDSETVFGVGGYYYASRNVGLGLALSTSDDADTFGVSIRWVP